MRNAWTNRCGVLCTIALACLAAGPGGAEDSDASSSDARARAILQESLDRIAAAESLRFRIQTQFDVVQSSGQTLEFGDQRTVSVRRPDRLRVDVQRREGDQMQLTYDGQNGVLYSPDQKAYAKVALGDSVENALEKLIGELGVPLPLAELLHEDVDSNVPALMESALYVGPASLDGVRCEHVAFEGTDADFQVWVDSSGSRLPRRIVITYRTEAGNPQFRADFTEWSLAPEVPDSLFAFTPPPGAQQLGFARVSGRDEERE